MPPVQNGSPGNGRRAPHYTGTFADGASARASPVTVTPQDAGLRITPIDGRGASFLWSWQGLRASGPLRRGEAPLLFHETQPDARLFIDNPAIVPLLLQHAPQLSPRHHHRRLLVPMLLAAALLLLLGVWTWRSDFSIARMVADALPDSLHRALGRAVTHSMTNGKVCAEPAGLAALRTMTERLAPDLPPAAHQRVMVAKIGMPNAFTTPGGYIVIGHELVNFARSPDEVAAVLAHEFGHAERRHPEAALVRAAGLSLIARLMFGDGSLGDAAGLLLQLGYSRQAERQADAIAIRRMRRAGADPAALAGFFKRLEKKYRGADASGGLAALFRTHPPTEERIRILRQARLTGARPILDAAAWQALRHVCNAKAPLVFPEE